MTILYSDPFTTTLSTTFWTLNSSGDWSIDTGRLKGINPLTSIVTKAAAHAAIANCKATFTRSSTGSSWDVGVLVRANSTATSGYFADPLGTGPSSTFDIWRIDGPGIQNDVQIGSTATITIADGDVYALEVSGTGGTVTLKAYQNGILRVTATDTSGSRIVSAGQTGIINWNSTNYFDDFLVEDLNTGGSILRPSNAIGSGGMQAMTGGMQGRAPDYAEARARCERRAQLRAAGIAALRRSMIIVPANYHAFGNRHAPHGLRV